MNKTVKTFEGELELGHLDMLVAASARDMWVEELQELAETDERIVFVTADGGYAGKENEFRLKHPDRMLPVGIAEMDQVGIASGLALCGKFRTLTVLDLSLLCVHLTRYIQMCAIRTCLFVL